MKHALLFCLAIFGATSSVIGASPTWVTVGNPGFGFVTETFSMSKFEITNEQYAEFLNAVAKTDANGLYNTRMGNTSNPSIIRSGRPGSYTYRAFASFAKHPVVLVRSDDARRYCNWLHNGKGSGSSETGAYDMSGGGTPARNFGALVWVPNQFEWEKAAFYSPEKPGGAGFYNYATRNDARPASARPSTTLTNAANHYFDDEISGNGINGGYALTNSIFGSVGRFLAPVGSYPASRSFYGTVDQSGNASELIDLGLSVFVGGSFADRGVDTLVRSYGARVWINDAEVDETGFRVAAVAPLVPDANPAALILPLNSPASFTASVIGLGAKLQWRRGTVNVGTSVEATSSSYNIAAVKLTDAGAYTMRGTNIVGSVTSPPADLVVVDTTTAVKHVFKETQTVSMTAGVAGNATGFLWKKDGADLVIDDATRFSGMTTKKLTIKRLKATDAGVYTCEVTGTAGMLASAPQTLFIVNAVPEISPGQTLDDAMVGGVYTPKVITVVSGDSKVPGTYSATGLPAGMRINTATGEIYGSPTAVTLIPKVYTVKITARNAIGPSTTVEIQLTVRPIPVEAVGRFVGIIAREPVLNANLGGRLEITSTTAGAYSGRVVLGGSTYSFKGGRLDMNVGVNNPKTIQVVRKGLSPLTLTWSVQLATDANPNTISGTVVDGEAVPNTASFAGWRNKWNSKSTDPAVFGEAFMGYHTFRLDMTTPGGVVPEGDGYGSFTVAKGGALTVAGRLPDNTPYTFATFAGPVGEIALYQSLYKNLGSILSSSTSPMKITSVGVSPSYVGNTVGGTINWLKKQQAASVRNYPAPFQNDMTVIGRKYNPVAPGTNALGSDVTTPVYTFAFAGGGDLSASARTPNASFVLSSAHRMTVPTPPVNFAGTTLSLNPKTGLFTGKFTLLDLVSRPVTYQGMVVRDSAGVGVGFGYFLLNQLLPSPTTSLQLSGSVKIGLP